MRSGLDRDELVLLFVSLVLIYSPVIHSCPLGSLSFGEYVIVCL